MDSSVAQLYRFERTYTSQVHNTPACENWQAHMNHTLTTTITTKYEIRNRAMDKCDTKKKPFRFYFCFGHWNGRSFCTGIDRCVRVYLFIIFYPYMWINAYDWTIQTIQTLKFSEMTMSFPKCLIFPCTLRWYKLDESLLLYPNAHIHIHMHASK